jgi:hypothetical protein
MSKRWLSEIGRYLRSGTGVPEETARSIQEEIEFHLGESLRDGVADGLSAQDARRQTLARFGDVGEAFCDCTHAAAEGHVRCHRFHLALTAALLVAVGALGALARLRAGRERAVAVDAAVAGDIEGRVVDDESQPIEAAHVLAVVKTWPPGGFRQQAYTAATRSDGSFAIDDVLPTEAEYEVQIAVVAGGRVLESSYFERQRGPLHRAEFRLAPSAPIAVRFEAADGQPVSGVEVFPFRRADRGGADHSVYFCSAEPVMRRSDVTGEVSLPYFSPGDDATVYMRAPGGHWNTRRFAVPEERRVVVIKMAPAQRNAVNDLPENLK